MKSIFTTAMLAAIVAARDDDKTTEMITSSTTNNSLTGTTLSLNTYQKNGDDDIREQHGNIILTLTKANVTDNTDFHVGFSIKNAVDNLYDGIGVVVNYTEAEIASPVGGWTGINYGLTSQPDVFTNSPSILTADGTSRWMSMPDKSSITDDGTYITITAHWMREMPATDTAANLDIEEGVATDFTVQAWYYGYQGDTTTLQTNHLGQSADVTISLGALSGLQMAAFALVASSATFLF